jgi:DTW domain-containing protein YfiP
MWDELRERMEWLRARNARRYTEGEDDGKAIAEACLMALESMGDIETRQTLKDAYKRMEESEPVQDDPQEIERRVKEMRGKTDE